MVHEIITKANPSVTLVLPQEMIGKTVEVIAFEIDEKSAVAGKEQRLIEIRNLTKSSMVNLSNFKFNRDEANNYDG